MAGQICPCQSCKCQSGFQNDSIASATWACSALPNRVPKTAKLGAISSYTGASREVRNEVTPARMVVRSHSIMNDSTMLTPACQGRTKM
jgi:hypothetical protein